MSEINNFEFNFPPLSFVASPMAQTIKSLPSMQETQVQSLGQEDPLEKEMATHSSYSCLETPMDRGVRRATVNGIPKSQMQLD